MYLEIVARMECSEIQGIILHFWRGMPEEPHPAWLLAECFMKPVVCYAVAVMSFATPGPAAIVELLAIGSGEPDGFSEKEFDPRSFNSLLCPDRTYDGATARGEGALQAKAGRVHGRCAATGARQVGVAIARIPGKLLWIGREADTVRHVPSFAARSMKSDATTSTIPSPSAAVSALRVGPNSKGRVTSAVLKPSFFAAIRSSI